MLFRFKNLSFLPRFTLGKNYDRKAQFIFVQDLRTYSPRHSWSAITTNSTFMKASFSLQSPLRSRLMGLAPPRGLATHCRLHCSMCVAQDIRAMLTWRRPRFLPRKLGLYYMNIQHIKGVALVTPLKGTPYGTSWRQPCNTCAIIKKFWSSHVSAGLNDSMSNPGKVLRFVSN